MQTPSKQYGFAYSDPRDPYELPPPAPFLAEKNGLFCLIAGMILMLVGMFLIYDWGKAGTGNLDIPYRFYLLCASGIGLILFGGYRLFHNMQIATYRSLNALREKK